MDNAIRKALHYHDEVGQWRFAKEEVDRLVSEMKGPTSEPSQSKENQEKPELPKADFLPGNQGELENGM